MPLIDDYYYCELDVPLVTSGVISIFRRYCYIIAEILMDHCKLTNRPPSTRISAPVTYLARSLARKTTGPATSSGAERTMLDCQMKLPFTHFPIGREQFAVPCILVSWGRTSLLYLCSLQSSRGELSCTECYIFPKRPRTIA